MQRLHTTDNPSTPHVLATLAHLGCATLSQIHALCFPQAFASTVRLALIGLVEAGLITHSHWRLSHGERCQVWTMTTKGLDRLRQDAPHLATGHAPDLNRPSTSCEKDEWQVRIAVRTLLVRLIMEARQQPVCATASVTTSLLYPVPLMPTYPIQPDAQITIAWSSPIVQATDWLPWTTPAAPSEPGSTCYTLHVERHGHPTTLARWVEHCVSTAQDATPLLILATPERYAPVTTLLQQHAAHAVRLCSRAEIATGWTTAPWRDARGQPCSITPAMTRNKT